MSDHHQELPKSTAAAYRRSKFVFIFRKLFNDFDPQSVANLDEERLLSMRVHGNILLSEPKLCAIVENAKQLLKIQQELGSFCARQVPAKIPKSELISKDLMQRGFRCVGLTVVYSFMQRWLTAQ